MSLLLLVNLSVSLSMSVFLLFCTDVFISLSDYLSVCRFVSPSICLFVCRSVCASVSLSVCASVSRSSLAVFISLTNSLFTCFSVYLCLFDGLSVCLSYCLSLSMFVCLSVSWSVSATVSLTLRLPLSLSVSVSFRLVQLTVRLTTSLFSICQLFLDRTRCALSQKHARSFVSVRDPRVALGRATVQRRSRSGRSTDLGPFSTTSLVVEIARVQRKKGRRSVAKRHRTAQADRETDRQQTERRRDAETQPQLQLDATCTEILSSIS